MVGSKQEDVAKWGFFFGEGKRAAGIDILFGVVVFDRSIVSQEKTRAVRE